ncbi:MAG: LD-carboxypeptidase [Desulfobacterales bacterium]|jgi:muramoyltetrapeptide carboxypeptidase|nr:LD-carboxypeptidase [Desulfobacterales bacterium]
MRVPARIGTSGHRKILRKPRRLGPGAVIGVAAPASPFDRETFDRGLQVLREMGFETVVHEEIMAADRYLAGPDGRRAALLQMLLEDDRIDAVICARGGYGCLRILPLLDFERIAAHPKIFIGFSDVTALLAAITRRCGFAAFHGPVVTSLADGQASTRDSLLAAIASDTAAILRPAAAATVRPGRAAGVVCGGNLTTLCHLIGTPFQPSFRGRLLFLEDRGEAPYRIDRMLTQLTLAGCLEGVRGLALGGFTDCGAYEEILGIFDERFADASIPILAGLPVGHAEPNLTLPLGIPAVLDADRQTLSFECATQD